MIAIRTTTTRARFSRRALLRRLGVGAACLPLIEAERALGAGAPRRLITVAFANGVAQPNFYSGNDDPTSGSVLQPLAALKSKVTVVAGLDLKIMIDGSHMFDGHFSYGTLFTGTYKNLGGQQATASGASIDQVVSDAIAKQVNLPAPLINVAVAGRSTSFRADGTRNTAETDPTRLFNALFAGKTLSPDRLDGLKARRKSILDYVGGELGMFGSRLGAEDKAKVTGHLDSIRKLELELEAGGAAAACKATAPVAGDYAAKLKAFNDLVAMAIRCDVSRAVSLTWADNGGSGPATMPFLNLSRVPVKSADGGSEIHAIAHQGIAGYAQKTIIDTWYTSQLAYLAKALDASPEAGSTALDNTLIVMSTDMAEGSLHSVNAIPFILVGSGGGAIKTGRTIKVGTWASRTGTYWKGANSGVPHNRLLASIAGAMGVPTESFGDAKYAGNLNAELKG
jgi:hypothetical protein